MTELVLHLQRIVDHRRTGIPVPWTSGPVYQSPDHIDRAIDDYLEWRAERRDLHASTNRHLPPLPDVGRVRRRIRVDLIEVGSPVNARGVEIGSERWYPFLAELPPGPAADPEAQLDDFNVDDEGPS